MFSVFITLAPLVLGLTAWGLSLFNALSRKQHRWIPTVSWFLCACALWFPLQAWNRWAQAKDVAALLDCAHAYALCAGVLLLGNLLLSVPTWIRFCKKEHR